MDTKRFFTSMLIAGALMLAFMYFFRGGNGGGSAVTGRYWIYDAIPKGSGPDNGNAPKTVTLGGAGKDDAAHLAVRVSNVMAGIERVQLNVKEFAQTVQRKEPLTLFDFGPEGKTERERETLAKMALPFSTLGIHITIENETKEIALGTWWKNPEGGYERREAKDGDWAEDISNANSIALLSRKFIWRVEDDQTTPTDAVFSASFSFQGTPVAKVYKRFHLDKDSYELTITHEVVNLLKDKTLHVRIDQLGGPQMSRDDPQADDRFFHGLALADASGGTKYVDEKGGFNLTHGDMRKAAAEKTEKKDEKTTVVIKEAGTIWIGTDKEQGQWFDFTKNPYLWVGSSNRFFAVVVRPMAETGNGATLKLSDGHSTITEPGHVGAGNVDLMYAADKAGDDVAIVRLTGRTLDVVPGGTMSEPLSVFMGPKNRNILGGEGIPANAADGTSAVAAKPDYKTYDYMKLVQFNTCWLYSFCVFDWLANGILRLLDIFKTYIAFGNYGVAIMILVLVVRAVLHPLTRASQVNMAKMGKQMRNVQPQMEAMKKKYADNKKKQSEEMMRIYKENNINPAGGIMGCLPMLIQMPIWAALYSGLRADIDLRHAAFIPGWINDLASPDRLFPTGVPVMGHPFFPIPLVGDIYGFNLLPILLTAVFYFQMKVTTATQPKPADEQQAQMAKMSQYMIFIFPLFLYNAPSGLNLYIFASTMGGLVDTYLVRKTLKKQGILAESAPLLPTREDADDAK